MSDNPFYRLAPFIQEYIYRNKWETLRSIQVQTSQAVFDSSEHILIMSGTASGKTEAAFLPVITDLYNHPPASIGALYIGPLKALINDQFQRLSQLLEESNIPVQSWHGDVGQSRKEKFLKKGQGILQITPESLEAMLIKRQADLGRLFGDLRFVVIDEVHAFIDSDRGRQVQCQLQRLERCQRLPARRIGLSATIGDPELAMAWLQGGTNNSVTLIDDKVNRRSVELGIEYFRQAQESDEASVPDAMFEDMYRLIRQVKKTLVFVTKRSAAEEVTVNLRDIAQRQHQGDIYYIHHGNIAAPLREAAETAMQTPDTSACTTATVTLELGIDLGQLDQVIELSATNTVSSFVQRLGRSGRRGGPSRMFFYIREPKPDSEAHVGEQVPWDLLQMIAIIQLYVEDRWIEPPTIPHLPLSLLYHQTMSCLVASTELRPAELAERILTLAPFSNITQDQYREVLKHLLDIGQLERTEIGGLIIGLAGEKVVNDYRFYATFQDDVLFQVRDTSREIGTIATAPAVGDRIMLAGQAWKVLDVNTDAQVIFVEPVRGKARPYWSGQGARIHTRVLERMRQILVEETDYSYVQPRAKGEIQIARDLARKSGLLEQSLLPLGGNRYLLLPWHGTRAFSTLALMLEYAGIQVKGQYLPFYIELKGEGGIDTLQGRLQLLAASSPSADELTAQLDIQDIQRNKFDQYLPEPLLRQAFGCDVLDISQALKALENILRHG